jgi:nucleotide-binding universal stress UspA family protein
MKKLLVTTDFSPNSKKGIHFAIQLALQSNCELIFFNVVEIFRPYIWDEIYYNQYELSELKRNQKMLEQFIHDIFRKGNIQKRAYTCVCKVGISASNKIIEYSKEIHADYLCVSTLGQGKLIQIIGSTASELIAFCPLPIFIVPSNYKSKPIINVCFASDLENFNDEIKKVLEFTIPIKATTNIVHFDYLVLLKDKKTKWGKLISKYQTEKVQFHLRELDSLYSLNNHIQKYIVNTKQSLLITFTKQNRNWFNRMFFASKTNDMIFDTKTPLLVFRK